MKFRAATVVLVSAGIVLAATACSSGGSTGGSAAPAKTKAAAAKTYTAADLPKILTSAEKTLGVKGTVLDDAQVQAKLKQVQGNGGISALLNTSGVTLSPASCGQTIKDALNQTPPAGSVNSILTYGSNTVTVTAISGKKLPTALATDGSTKLDGLLKTCSTMKISVTQSGQTLTIPFTIKKSNVTTDADTTTGLVETVTVPTSNGGSNKPITVEAVSAVAGNLYISAQASSTAVAAAAVKPAASTPSVADAINAVVAAAK
ncbi:hypothetical protein GCM10025867_09750 [Frondihabitans sucicola]|uniref:Lipoprotein n=1 Tax=Frondihabitans sucicola TaxID=1268041 RepID=A0ABN6XUM8_9MICO|nr:hypothetical protein [Frondihabitans sucicola]BDZ48734.1 hypothetical protein GCM10025867_09750 [Frondihabitans sucicola]